MDPLPDVPLGRISGQVWLGPLLRTLGSVRRRCQRDGRDILSGGPL